MKKKRLILLSLALLIALAPITVFASDVTGALWRGTVKITNSGNTTATDVIATANINSQALIDNGYAADNLTDVAVMYGGNDVAFMPSVNSSYPWAFFVDSISAGLNIDYSLYSGNATGGKIRYFPGDAGMSANHSATLKLADNFTVEVSGFYNPVSGNIVVKDDAFYFISDNQGNIYSYLDSVSWTTPTSHAGTWDDSTFAYDDDTGTGASIGTAGWSAPIDLYYSDNIGISQLRYWSGGSMTEFRFSLYYNGQWNVAYEGVEVGGSYQTVDIDFAVSDRCRVEAYNELAQVRYLYEFDFGSVPYVSASGLTADEYTFKTTMYEDVAVNFDGVDDAIIIPHDANQLLTTGGTIEAWIKPNSIGETWGRIVDKGTSTIDADGYGFGTDATNRVSFQINGGTRIYGADNSVVFGDGNWYHVVATWDNTGYVNIYVNGAESGTPGISANATGITTTNALTIGNRSTATDRTFDGEIDGVRIYSRVLGLSEIAANHALGRTGDPAPTNSVDLEGWWKLSEGTGVTAVDSIASIDGTLTNGPTWDDRSLKIWIDDAATEADYAAAITLSVPDNSENWTYYENMGGWWDYTKIWCGETLQQWIEWEYNPDLFTDLSGKGHHADPTFITDTSDNISASLISFNPVNESEIDTFALSTSYDILIADATPEGNMFDDGDYSKLPAAPINALLDEGGVPRAAWWLPFIFLGICVIGFITYGATTMTRGPTGKLSEGQIDGSLLIMFVVMEALLVAFGKMGPIPLWPSYLFPIAGIALILSRKHFAWG